MVFSHGVVVFYFAYIMFVVLFLSGGEYHVKGSEIFLANVGENITMYCTGRSSGTIFWYKGTLHPDSYIASVDIYNQGFLYQEYDNNHFSQFYEASADQKSLTLGVYDVNVDDSANYTCHFNRNSRKTYDVRVIECIDCIVDSSRRFDLDKHDKKDVYCSLINFHGPQLEHKVNIMVNNNKNKTAFIEKDTLIRFTISISRLYRGISIELNPYPEKRNLGSDITCNVLPQPSTHSTSSLTTASTMVITTQHEYPWTSEKSSSVSTHPTSSPITNSSITTTAQHEYPSTSTKLSSVSTMSTYPSHNPTSISSVITATKYDQESTSAIKRSSPSATDIPFTSNATFFSTFTKPLQNNIDTSSFMSTSSVLPKMSTTYEPSLEDNNSDSATVLIITTAGSFVLAVLVVIFLIVRRKQTKRRHQRKSYQIDTNGPSADKAAPGKRDHELIGEVSQTQPCELVDNILYDSSDGVIAGSASTSDDQLDTVLYTVPDKTGIIKRVAVSKIIPGPSDLMNPHGNNAMILHHEATGSKQGQEKRYKDVTMTGKGRDDDIPLYAMPNKGPRSAKNNPKSRPGSESHDDDGDAEIPLYSTPDKRRR